MAIEKLNLDWKNFGETGYEDSKMNKIKMGDITDKIDEIIDSENSLNAYSETEELAVGTWIDGKTVFRKVFSGTTSTDSNSTQLITNVDNLVRTGGFILVPGGLAVNCDSSDGTNWSRITLDRGTHILYFYTSESYRSRTFSVFVEYTKI